MPTIDEVRAQIRALGTTDQFGTKKEIKSLPEILSADEVIKGLASGLMDGNTWLITCTNKRIIFLDKGMVYGLAQVEIPLEKVNSIEYTTGLLLGKIGIWDGASKMQIKQVDNDSVRPFVAAVNQAIEDVKKAATAPTSSPAAQELDVASQLERLAALKEKGFLTQEEFDSQKKKLLGM